MAQHIFPPKDMEVSKVMWIPSNHPFIDGFSVVNHPFLGIPHLWTDPHLYFFQDFDLVSSMVSATPKLYDIEARSFLVP